VTGIFPLNVDALNLKMGPKEVYGNGNGEQHAKKEGNPTIVPTNYDKLQL